MKNEQVEQLSAWETFWTIYPRKVGKFAAQKAWARIKPEEHAAVLEGLAKQVRYWRVKGTEWDYMPHPSTWLNGGRWLDEFPLAEAVRPLSSAQANDVTGIAARDDYQKTSIPPAVLAELQRMKRR